MFLIENGLLKKDCDGGSSLCVSCPKDAIVQWCDMILDGVQGGVS